MLIHELAKKTSLSAHTIRFYEKAGLIQGKRDETVQSNNYLHYDAHAVDRLEFIVDAKSVGFTIKEIGEMIDAWYHDRLTAKDKIKLLDSKLAALDLKLKEIKAMQKKIARFKEDIVYGRCP